MPHARRHGHDHEHGEGGHEHHHHHHGNPDELDVVIMPVKSLDERDLTTARDAAALVFSDWESRTKEGDTPEQGLTGVALDGAIGERHCHDQRTESWCAA